MNAKYKPIALYILENYIDEIMAESGFKRRSNALIYSRTIGTTKQKLDMVCYSHPPYYPGTLLHIYPWLSVYYPEINRTIQNIKSEADSTLGNMKDITSRQPIQIGYPDMEQWKLMTDSKEEIDVLAEKIRIFLKQHTIPLLDELETIDDYIDKYVQQDKRIRLDHDFFLLVASAYAFKEEYAKGLEILENRFGKPGLRKYYTKAFAYFETKLNI